MRFNKNNIGKFVAGGLATSMFFMSIVGIANAAYLNTLSDTQSSLKAGALSNHDISFVTPTGVTTGQTILVTFSSGTSMNASLSYTDVDVLVNGGQQTLGATNGAAQWGVVRTSATVLTITAPSAGTPAAAGATIRIKIGTNATNQSTGVYQTTNDVAGAQVYTIGGGTFADSGSITENIVTDDTVVLTAKVPQSLSFSISTTTLYFGTLGAGTPKFASSTNSSGDTTNNSVANTLAVSTNATAGYTITVQGASLTSAQNSSDVIDEAGAVSSPIASSTEMFGITATKSGGINGTIASQFATPDQFGFNSTATTSVTFASGTTPTNTETYSLKYIASISSLTPAGDYSTGLIYVATANF